MLVMEKTSLAMEIENLTAIFGKKRSALLPIVQAIQKKYRYISEYAQQEIARHLDIHPVEVYSVVSFYSFTDSKSKGRNIVRLCRTIACDMKGKEAICRAIERELDVKIGGTTPDNKFTLEYANCIGLCDVGPSMAVNEKVYTHLTPEKAVQILNSVR